MIRRIKRTFIFAGSISLTLLAMILLQWTNNLPIRYRAIWISGQETANAQPTGKFSFINDWCRVRKARQDWKGILKPCNRNLTWSSKLLEKSLRTGANTSSIVSWDLKPAGEFSRFFIQSRTAESIDQNTGGDSWRVRIKGTAHISPTVFDHDNGKYEVLFLPMEGGVYKADIVLDYSLCDGYRDPPDDWFIKGNSQGKHQPEGMLGKLDDYLLEPLQGRELIEFTILQTDNSTTSLTKDPRALNMECGPDVENSCRFLWDGQGRWLQRIWKPFVQGLLLRPRFRDLSKGRGVLWCYGDSLNYNIYRYNFNESRLCKHMFSQCRNNINFIYHIKYRIELDTTETDHFDFNVTRVINHFRSVLMDPEVNHVNSVIFLNMGLHYVMGLTLERYEDLIQRTIGLIKETERDSRGILVPRFKGHVIWKTTTAINKEKAKKVQATKWRFCTLPRVQLFNAYATSAMCQAGVDIVDMYPITDSYPDGTYDVVHYRPPASQPLVSILVNYLRDPLEQEIPYDMLNV